MTEQPVAYPGYATPTFTRRRVLDDWLVRVAPEARVVGRVHDTGTQIGWTAFDARGAYVGLYPDKQAAGEALVKHAGYEVLQ